MRRSRLIRLSLVVLALAAACGPSMTMQGESGARYGLAVVNPMAVPVELSYTDADGRHPLGTVAAESRRRFAIGGAASANVLLIAEPTDGGGPIYQNITLRAGQTVEVVLE